jgi:hypothetical protein
MRECGKDMALSAMKIHRELVLNLKCLLLKRGEQYIMHADNVE